MFKFETQLSGFVWGLVAPLLGFWLYYLFKYHNFHQLEFAARLVQMGLSSAVLSLCLLTNLAIFFTLLQFNREKAAKGVLGATILYAFVGFGLKFFI